MVLALRQLNLIHEKGPYSFFCFFLTFNFWCCGCFMCCLYTLVPCFNLSLSTPVSPLYSSKQPKQLMTYMTLKLLQYIRVFDVNILFTFLNVNSLDINNNSQHFHRKSWHFLTCTSSVLNSGLVSSLLKLGGCHLQFISLMLSNRGIFLS